MAFEDKIRELLKRSSHDEESRKVARHFTSLFKRTTGRGYPGPIRGPKTRRKWSKLLANLGLSAKERHEICTRTADESELSARWHQPGFLWNALLQRLGKPASSRRRPGRPKGSPRVRIEQALLAGDDPNDVATRFGKTINYVRRISREIRAAVHN